MTHYAVTYPTAGQLTVYVEADSEEEAIDKGWELTGDPDAEHYWEPMEQIVQGNVLYAPLNTISVEADE